MVSMCYNALFVLPSIPKRFRLGYFFFSNSTSTFFSSHLKVHSMFCPSYFCCCPYSQHFFFSFFYSHVTFKCMCERAMRNIIVWYVEYAFVGIFSDFIFLLLLVFLVGTREFVYITATEAAATASVQREATKKIVFIMKKETNERMN